MATLLGRQLTEPEQTLQATLAHLPVDLLTRSARRGIAALEIRDEFYAPALSLVEVPVAAGWQRELCAYLIAQPTFLTYLARPDQFSEADLLRICRVLAGIDDMVDVKLANAMRMLHEQNHSSDAETIVRLLGVLDKISPGRRVVMGIMHLLRVAHPAAASKAALFLGKRVQNTDWVERQMASSDARVRANLIESIWGVNNPGARRSLQNALLDSNNRVVGNALMGLHLLKDPSVPTRARSMIRHSNPSFRSTATWLMGKIASPDFRSDLVAALNDESAQVRSSASKALGLLPNPHHLRDSSQVDKILQSHGLGSSRFTTIAQEPEDGSDLIPSRSFIPFAPRRRR